MNRVLQAALIGLCCSSFAPTWAQRQIRIVTEYILADFENDATDQGLTELYGSKWTQKKDSLDRVYIQSLNRNLHAYGYEVSKEATRPEYLLKVVYTEIDLDGAVKARTSLYRLGEGQEKLLNSRKLKVKGDEEAYTYVMIEDESFEALGNYTFRNQMRPLFLSKKMESDRSLCFSARLSLETRANFDWGRSTYVAQGLGADVILNYSVNSQLMAGAGVGVGQHDYVYGDLESRAEVPVFAQIRYEILPRRVRPYIIGQVGYTFGTIQYYGWYEPWFKTKFHEGLFFKGGVGVACRLRRGSLFLDACYRQQQWDCSLSPRRGTSLSVGYMVPLGQ